MATLTAVQEAQELAVTIERKWPQLLSLRSPLRNFSEGFAGNQHLLKCALAGYNLSTCSEEQVEAILRMYQLVK